ncbi:heavy metal translocating P-type ATPase [Xinfangfangia pollutisoli]|uniref:heavy metal translocating P-type ATPase n=1 Tax=Xinfangfangia pollutisoli TaxID=2865960 RepID=UPI001CD77390|nr:heavy metal translocating P-type ATPase [Xinfangfangia pollutisoli]
MREATKYQWTVSGMDCAACTVKVTKAVERLPGVSEVKVALMSERLSLALAPGATAPGQVEETVRKLGYQIAPLSDGAGARSGARAHVHGPGCAGHGATADHDHDHDHDHGHDHGAAPAAAGHLHDDPADRGKPWYRSGKGRLVLGTGLLLALAWGFELFVSAEYGGWAFALACVIGLAPVAQRAFAALRLGQPFTIESLMTIAALGALVIGAAEEAALVVFLFAVGEVLEGVAAGKARDSIRALGDLVPKTALLEQDGRISEVPADSLLIGQTVLVRPGDRIPADGEIVEGTSGIDESPVTGESVPVTRGPGAAVYAGAINTEAALRIRVSREPADNTIARIIRLVEEAEEARAPTERFIDRFSRWYMPAIVAVSALVVLLPPLALGLDWQVWIYRGLALLLIGCPCALVISVPASIASALSSGARRGLLMKGGAVIEAAAAVRRIAFDKTGTLTHGKPVVTDLRPAPDVAEGDLLAVAAAVEAGSSHPLAQAILRRADQQALAPLPAREARAIPGKGVQALVEGAQAWVASPRHAAEAGGLAPAQQDVARALEAEGKTVVAVFREGQPLGLIALRDEPRADAAEAMRQLRAMGIAPVILTGDNPRTAEAIAGQLGMAFRAEMLPEDKLGVIREMAAEGGVMMIGDGINDAPALKQAGVGVAMGSGTDVALETADAAILRDRVQDVPALIRLARATMGNIRQNVAVALGLKAVFLVTSVLGLTGLWIAILADTGATVLVTLNALRLLRFDPTREG